MKIKHLFLAVFLAMFFLSGCNELVTPVLENPNDPESPSFKGNPPSFLSVKSISANAVKLIWKDSSNFENNYVIQRSTNKRQFEEIAILPSNLQEYTDTTLDIANSYTYRIKCVSSKNNSTFSDSVSIKNDPYISEKTLTATGVKTLCFSPDETLKASSDGKGSIIILSSLDNSVKRTLAVTASAISFTNNNSLVISNNKTKNIEVWNIADGTLSRSFAGTQSGLVNISLSPDNLYLAGSGNDSSMRVWDFNSGKEVYSSQAGTVIRNLTFSRSSKYLTVSTYWQLFLLETGSWNVLHCFWYGADEAYPDITFSPDDKYVLYKLRNYISIWDIESQAAVKQLSAGGAFACSPDLKILALIDASGFLQVWQMDKLNTTKLIKLFSAQISYPGPVTELHVSANGDIDIVYNYSVHQSWKYYDKWVRY